VRRLLEWCGVQVARLIRVQFGPYALRDLPPGATARAPFKPLLREYLRRRDAGAAAWDEPVPPHLCSVAPRERSALLRAPAPRAARGPQQPADADAEEEAGDNGVAEGAGGVWAAMADAPGLAAAVAPHTDADTDTRRRGTVHRTQLRPTAVEKPSADRTPGI
jgi:hypothetical protein